MSSLLQGPVLIVALLAGSVALFAPCCISVMLPAYFAGAFRRRRALIAMTFVFAAGVATIILPIAIGATAVSRVIFGYHTVVFLIGGLLLLAMGVLTITGWRPNLPMLGMRAGAGRGAGSVYVLGVFSGAASACCAPVLAGVIALSGAAASFPAAVLIGTAYVLGMVLPLFAIALLWDRFDWGRSRLFTGGRVALRLGRRVLTVQPMALAGGLLLIAMGVLVIQLAVTGPAMNPEGWQAWLTAQLDHIASRITAWLSPVPGWVIALVVAAMVAALAWLALRQSNTQDDGAPSTSPPAPGLPAIAAEARRSS
jgi:cytochrome c-type biogenesis protein